MQEDSIIYRYIIFVLLCVLFFSKEPSMKFMTPSPWRGVRPKAAIN